MIGKDVLEWQLFVYSSKNAEIILDCGLATSASLSNKLTLWIHSRHVHLHVVRVLGDLSFATMSFATR